MKIYHVVSGYSAAGSLRYLLNENNEEDKILNFVDDLSNWPLWLEYTEEKIKARISWIKNHLFRYDFEWSTNDIIPSYTQQMYKLFATLRELSPDDKLYIWVWEWVIEQLMLRRILCSTNHSNIFVVKIEDKINELGYAPKAMWECSPAQIGELIKTATLLPEENKKQYRKEYKEICEKNHILHIYKDKKVIWVDKEYYDNLIMSFVADDFIPAAQVVGNTLGHSEQKLIDNYIQYRLNVLIEQGKIITEGETDILYDFKVKKA